MPTGLTAASTTNTARETPLIARHWRGVARAEAADRYAAHLETATFPALARIDGFVSAVVLRRPLDDGVEFVVVTTWRSMAAIVRFAGARPEDAVVPHEVRDMMVAFDRQVTHYEIAAIYHGPEVQPSL
jgi:heme-degrading monooxygenase HmoA